MSTLIHVAWGILLQRYTNRNNVVFGTTVSGRTAKLEGIEESAGLYINTLPFRVISEDKETINILLHETEKEIRTREAYEGISLAELQADIGLGNDTGLFDTLLVIENYPIKKQLENREGIIKDINITRTVGWFTAMYPVILEIDSYGDIGYNIRNVKEQLRHIPAKGIGYGILKYLTSWENKKALDFSLEAGYTFQLSGTIRYCSPYYYI